MSFTSKPRWLIMVVGLLSLMMALPVLGEPSMQPPPTSNPSFSALFASGETPTEVTDLSGNFVGQGVHVGEVRCKNGHCNKRIQLDLSLSQPLTDVVTLEYRFTTLQALVPEDGRAVVSGTGTIFSRSQQERFLFTATFQDNGDGTVWVRYEASRPDASFIIPRAPGSFEITGQP